VDVEHDVARTGARESESEKNGRERENVAGLAAWGFMDLGFRGLRYDHLQDYWVCNS
jgi:hypothetical protein